MAATTEDLLAALQQVEKRADRWPTEQEILATYVEERSLVGALAGPDNGIVYGRRGTGKTHTLRFLGEREREKGNLALFIDLDQMVGSTSGIYSDTTLPIPQRATRLLVDVLGVVQDALIEDAFARPVSGLLELLDQVLDNVGEVVVVEQAEREITHSDAADEEDSARLTGSFGLSGPQVGLSVGGGGHRQTRADERSRVTGHLEYRVHFGGVSPLLRRALALNSAERIWLLFDEWSNLPMEIQPYLAEMLRRLFFGVPKTIVRIAAIPHRTLWRIQDSAGGYIGLETGAEVFSLLDLDEFVVFPARSQEEQRERAATFFRSLLFRHLSQVLADSANGPPNTQEEMISLLFTQVTAFHELVRAAEGVPRDALVIASRAALRAGERRISTDHVRDAAARVYQTNKQALLNGVPKARQLLQIIIDEVISKKKARAFMLDENSTQHPIIQQLVDDRILHIIKRGYSHQDEAGARFDVLQIDYGCYVGILHTSSAPLTLFGENTLADDAVLDTFYGGAVVPDDDYRAIRRSVLDLDDALARIGTG